MRQAPAISQFLLLLKPTVGDHSIARWGCDDKFTGRFVVRMIHHWQPLARLIGPVQAEEGPLAVPVLADPHAARGHATIADGELPAFSGFRGRRELDTQA